MATRDVYTMRLSFGAMTQHGLVLLLVGSMLPDLMETFQIGEANAGLLMGVGSVGFMIGPVIAGQIADRAGVRAALLLGLAAEIVGLVLFGFAPLFVVAIAANVLIRFGAAFVETGVNVMPTLVRSSRSPHGLMNLVHMFFGVGAIVAPIFIGIYLEATGAWRPILFFAIVPSLLVLVATVRRLDLDSDRAGVTPTRGTARVLFAPHVLLGALTLFLYVGAELGVSSWVVYYLQIERALSPTLAGLGLSILWVFVTLGRFLNAQLGDRFSSRLLVTISGISSALSIGVFLLSHGVVGAYLSLAWVGISLSGVFPHVMGELNNKIPGMTGTVTAVMAIGASSGAALFQWLVGFVAERIGLTIALSIPAILQLALVGTFLLAVRAADRLDLA